MRFVSPKVPNARALPQTHYPQSGEGSYTSKGKGEGMGKVSGQGEKGEDS